MKPNAIVLKWDGKLFQIHYDKNGEIQIYEISEGVLELYDKKINKEAKVYSVQIPTYQNQSNG